MAINSSYKGLYLNILKEAETEDISATGKILSGWQ